MASAPEPAPTQVRRDLELSSSRYCKVSTELSECVVVFQEWLASLPGKVESYYWLPGRQTDHYQEGIVFRKWDGSWRLCWIVSNYALEDDDDVTPLTDVSVDKKIEAIESFPKLLQAMSDEHKRLSIKVQSVRNGFAKFAEELGIPPKKGGK